MLEHYTVAQGDCVSSIAYEYGLFPDTVWNHAENATLKDLRKDPNILSEGDVVYIPDKRLKDVSGATETRHRFKRKGVPEKIKIIIKDERGRPRSGVSYILTLDGAPYEGTTGGDGLVERSISPDTRQATLKLREGETETTYELPVGDLDPITETSGVQMRLRNLNLYRGEIDGELTEDTQWAIENFQSAQNLKATGDLDKATRDRIKEVHGS